MKDDNQTYYKVGWKCDFSNNGRTIYLGPHGGKYYVNANGKIVYIKNEFVMKYLLFLFFFVVVAFDGWSQNLLYDKPRQDGTRVISSTELFVRNGFMDRNPFYYTVMAAQADSDSLTVYSLYVRINGSKFKKLEKGGLMLIKNTEGLTIESRNAYDESDTYDAIQKNLYGLYPLTKEQMQEVVKGIAKIRIETPLGLIDVEYSNDKASFISKGLKERFEEINEALAVKKDIRDGF